jgi:hypothetical protein
MISANFDLDFGPVKDEFFIALISKDVKLGVSSGKCC